MDQAKAPVRDHLLSFCIAAMWAGMLWSRAMMSFAVVAFVAVAVLAYGPALAWSALRREKMVWGLLLLFVIPLLTFPWTQEKDAWVRVMQLKLPLLALPFTLGAMRTASPRSIRLAARSILAMTLLASVAVLVGYAMNMSEVHASYLRGAVMRVPMDNDHVRFGWALALMYLIVLDGLSFDGLNLPGLERRTAMIILVFLSLTIFILSSRTGLLGFFLVNGVAIWRSQGKRDRRYIITSLVLAPLLAFALLPSLRNRVRFMVWDFQNYSLGSYREGLNDAPRIISWQAGMDMMKERPTSGTGFGELHARMEQWYAINRPAMPAYEHLDPSNEWLYHGAAAGLPGMSLFTIAVLLTYRRKACSSWHAAWWLAVLGFLYEVGLETQFGIFLFAFFLVWFLAQERRREPA